MVRILHVSDLHFGRKNLPEQVEALLALVAREKFDVVAVSGDLTQRARDWEFAKARAFLETADRTSRTIAVPGNHDCTWWRAPVHVGPARWHYAKWRKYFGRETEPTLRVPGAVLVGVATGHGITVNTLTTRLRDLSVIGDIRPSQIARVARECAPAPDVLARVVVMHHNPVAGKISQRFGFRREYAPRILHEFVRAGVNLVLCGHDHEEAVNSVEHAEGRVVVSTAGTITTMSRGKRPTSVNAIEVSRDSLVVRVMPWNGREFVDETERRFG